MLCKHLIYNVLYVISKTYSLYRISNHIKTITCFKFKCNIATYTREYAITIKVDKRFVFTFFKF